MALLDQLAVASPLAGHEQDALAAGHHGLLLHLDTVLHGEVFTGAAPKHGFAQCLVERFVFKRCIVHEGQAVKAGREFPIGAHAGRQVLANDFFSQRPGQCFKVVAVIEAALCGRVHFLTKTGGQLLDQLRAGLVAAAVHHGWRVRGIEVLGAMGMPFGRALDEVHDLHAHACSSSACLAAKISSMRSFAASSVTASISPASS